MSDLVDRRHGLAPRRATGATAPPGRPRLPKRGKVVRYALMALVVLIYLYPLLFLLNTALKSNAEFFSNPTGVWSTRRILSNFATAWRQGQLRRLRCSTACCTRSSRRRSAR